ncbi:MAG: multidrug transporter [Gammaproteobacteria bacterium]|nr:multidrug transporter [Gammaproteobacteria bacterium]
MATQALFYQDIAAVSSSRHADLCVDRTAGFEFSSKTNYVPLAGSEFERAAWYYPIVFLVRGEDIVPAAVLGFGDEDNLFVNGMQWDCDYVPAYIRRYPFILANVTEGGTFTLCIDQSYAGCQEHGKGERLFLIGGGRTPFLEQMLAFVQQYQVETASSIQACKQVAELELFEPMQAQVALNSGQKLALGGFMTIDRERLRALSPESLHALSSTGVLELLYLHLFSLANFGSLMDRHAANAAAATEEDGDAAR